MFSLIYAWINCWVNNREAGDSRRHRAHYDVIVMILYNEDSNMCYFIHNYIFISMKALTSAGNQFYLL